MRTAADLEAAAARVIADGPVPVCKLARTIPADREGKLGHASAITLARWITAGRYGIHLDGARLTGKGWCSSPQALARFAAAVAAAEQGTPAPPAPCERERRAKAAGEELERLRREG